MGVLRISSSGKAIQFITDEGVIYQQGVNYLSTFLQNPLPNRVLPLTRMPFMVKEGAFAKSEVYEPSVDMPDAAKELLQKNAFSKEAGKVMEQVKAYEDKQVW